MSIAVARQPVSDEVIGNYKIEHAWMPGVARVRKALGPWPMRNWSWISFYDGRIESCREYVEWAERIDAGDRELIEHAAEFVAKKLGVAQLQREIDGVEHLPKTWGYDFRQALSLFPKQRRAQSGVSIELLLAFILVSVMLICGFIYHSM